MAGTRNKALVRIRETGACKRALLDHYEWNTCTMVMVQLCHLPTCYSKRFMNEIELSGKDNISRLRVASFGD